MRAIAMDSGRCRRVPRPCCSVAKAWGCVRCALAREIRFRAAGRGMRAARSCASAPILGESRASLWHERERRWCADRRQGAEPARGLACVRRRTWRAERRGASGANSGARRGDAAFVDGRELREAARAVDRRRPVPVVDVIHDCGAACRGVQRRSNAHRHSRVLPGSLAELDRDATVFWNDIDLRLRASVRVGDWKWRWMSEALVVRIRGHAPPREDAQDFQRRAAERHRRLPYVQRGDLPPQRLAVCMRCVARGGFPRRRRTWRHWRTRQRSPPSLADAWRVGDASSNPCAIRIARKTGARAAGDRAGARAREAARAGRAARGARYARRGSAGRCCRSSGRRVCLRGRRFDVWMTAMPMDGDRAGARCGGGVASRGAFATRLPRAAVLDRCRTRRARGRFDVDFVACSGVRTAQARRRDTCPGRCRNRIARNARAPGRPRIFLAASRRSPARVRSNCAPPSKRSAAC